MEEARPVTPKHAQLTKTVGALVDPRLPKIMLQRPTPEHHQPPTTGLGFSIPVAPPSPSPSPLSQVSAAIQAMPHGSPPLGHLGNINVPQVEDAALQKFFHDIAEQLQLIGSASPRSSIAMDSPMASPALSQGGSTAPTTPIPTPEPTNLPILQSAMAQHMPVKPRPAPSRAYTDGPAPVGPRVDLGTQRRRSYLGDASSRDNTVTQTQAQAHRHSVQLVGDKNRRASSRTASESGSRRKSRREFGSRA